MNATKTRPAEPPAIAAWLRRQAPAIRKAIRERVDFDADVVRDAGIGEPSAGAVACLLRLAELDVVLPSVDYFKTAHALLDQGGAVAFAVGVANFRSETELRIFLALAGTALLGDESAIRRFERGLRPDSPLDDVVLYLQAELEMLGGGFPGE